jgi:hypothetical protein
VDPTHLVLRYAELDNLDLVAIITEFLFVNYGTQLIMHSRSRATARSIHLLIQSAVFGRARFEAPALLGQQMPALCSPYQTRGSTKGAQLIVPPAMVSGAQDDRATKDANFLELLDAQIEILDPGSKSMKQKAGTADVAGPSMAVPVYTTHHGTAISVSRRSVVHQTDMNLTSLGSGSESPVAKAKSPHPAFLSLPVFGNWQFHGVYGLCGRRFC